MRLHLEVDEQKNRGNTGNILIFWPMLLDGFITNIGNEIQLNRPAMI